MKVLFLEMVHPILMKRLEEAGHLCIPCEEVPIHETLHANPDAQGLVIRSNIIADSALMACLPDLKFIARSGAGIENVDLLTAGHLGIEVFNSPEGNQNAVGEHTLGMLLALLNKLRSADASVRRGVWDREEHRGIELAGRTVGIFGYGHMGEAFATKLSGMGCTVIAYDKYRSGFGSPAAPAVEQVDLESFKRRTQILSIHCNLTAETHGLFDREMLHSFAQPLVLLHTARGPILRTADLLDALQTGCVTAAALDVFERESDGFEALSGEGDPVWTRLLAHPQVLLSPHVAGWTRESYFKLSDVLADKILAWAE
jgi:D-3-phosphoglycerate dehydrogenase